MSDLLDPKTLTAEELYKLQSDTWMQGANAERERLVAAFVERYPNHIVEVIDIGMGETYKSHDNCPKCVAVALIKGENK